jgi:hypothetical protein
MFGGHRRCGRWVCQPFCVCPRSVWRAIPIPGRSPSTSQRRARKASSCFRISVGTRSWSCPARSLSRPPTDISQRSSATRRRHSGMHSGEQSARPCASGWEDGPCGSALPAAVCHGCMCAWTIVPSITATDPTGRTSGSRRHHLERAPREIDTILPILIGLGAIPERDHAHNLAAGVSTCFDDHHGLASWPGVNQNRWSELSLAKKVPSKPVKRRFRTMKIANTIDLVLHWLKWPVACFALFLLPGTIFASFGLIRRVTGQPGLIWPFISGCVLYALLWRLLFRHRVFGTLLSTFEHELTHALFALATFHPVTAFRATAYRGGHVSVRGQGNWLITISPYFFPTACVFAGLMSWLVSVDSTVWRSGLMGFAFAYHVVSTKEDTPGTNRAGSMSITGERWHGAAAPRIFALRV